MTITSPHNQKLKEIRKLSQRRRGASAPGQFVAEGEDLLAAADAAGWAAVERYCAAGSGLPGHRGRAGRCWRPLRARLGYPDAGGLRGALGAGSGGPLCVYLHGVRDPGNVGTVLRSAAGVRRLVRRLRPRHRRPVRAQGGAGEHGRGVRRAARPRVDDVGRAARAPTIALVAGRGPAAARAGQLYRSATPRASRC